MTTQTYHEVPKSGIFKITVDNSPFPLSGKTFSYSQIMLAQQGGTLGPGMKFGHKEKCRADFVLTASGLMPLPKKQTSRSAADDWDDSDEMGQAVATPSTDPPTSYGLRTERTRGRDRHQARRPPLHGAARSGADV